MGLVGGHWEKPVWEKCWVWWVDWEPGGKVWGDAKGTVKGFVLGDTGLPGRGCQ